MRMADTPDARKEAVPGGRPAWEKRMGAYWELWLDQYINAPSQQDDTVIAEEKRPLNIHRVLHRFPTTAPCPERTAQAWSGADTGG